MLATTAFWFLRPHDDLESEIGQSFGEEALRCTDQEDRLLEPLAIPDEPDLLARVLGVVAGIGLVGDEVRKEQREHRQVDVYVDART